jgi:hypothetical protein
MLRVQSRIVLAPATPKVIKEILPEPVDWFD